MERPPSGIPITSAGFACSGAFPVHCIQMLIYRSSSDQQPGPDAEILSSCRLPASYDGLTVPHMSTMSQEGSAISTAGPACYQGTAYRCLSLADAGPIWQCTSMPCGLNKQYALQSRRMASQANEWLLQCAGTSKETVRVGSLLLNLASVDRVPTKFLTLEYPNKRRTKSAKLSRSAQPGPERTPSASSIEQVAVAISCTRR